MTLTPEQLAKSREEFELHCKNNGISRENYGGEYFDDYKSDLLKGWLARQESLVVELPERNNNENRPEFSGGWNSCINRFIKYLKSAGINYREKE